MKREAGEEAFDDPVFQEPEDEDEEDIELLYEKLAVMLGVK